MIIPTTDEVIAMHDKLIMATGGSSGLHDIVAWVNSHIGVFITR